MYFKAKQFTKCDFGLGSFHPDPAGEGCFVLQTPVWI